MGEGKGKKIQPNVCSRNAAVLIALCHQVFFFVPQLSLKDEECLLAVVKAHFDESGMAFYHLVLEGVAGGPGQRGNILIMCKTSNSHPLDFFLSHC